MWASKGEMEMIEVLVHGKPDLKKKKSCWYSQLHAFNATASWGKEGHKWMKWTKCTKHINFLTA